jgi:small-conductance mechanosensitive channel
MATTPLATNSNYLTSTLSQPAAVDPAAVSQRINTAISNSQVPDQSATVKSAQNIVKSLPGYNARGGTTGVAAVGQAAVSNFQSQLDAAKKQSANQAAGLQTKGEAVTAYAQNLTALGQTAQQGMADSVAAWNKYTTTADQYLKDSAARMSSVTQDIKNTIDQYAKTNDKALANSIQSGVNTWLQTNKSTERAIAEQYGTSSPEYQGWMSSKRASIGAMVSDLTAKAWDRTQQILNTGIGAVAGAETQLATDVNLAQKNSLDALNAAAAAGDQYQLNNASYQMTIEAAKNTAWSDLADWLDQSPVTAVDAQPMLAQLLDLQQTADAAQPSTSWTVNGMNSGSGRKVA